jgi:hypothetical protein
MNITTGHKGLKSSQSVSGEKIWTTMWDTQKQR